MGEISEFDECDCAMESIEEKLSKKMRSQIENKARLPSIVASACFFASFALVFFKNFKNRIVAKEQ